LSNNLPFSKENNSVKTGNVMKSVMLKMKDKTVIAIAHRLNSIAGFDRIILFREGKIVGQGTFEELLHTDSYFKELYNANVQ
jgi:ATP-binding cassette subfamily B protein